MKIEVKNWNELTHVDELTNVVSDDTAIFLEVREVLKKHDALAKYGICLLHKHFDLSADEVLLETCDVANRALTVRPAQKHAVDAQSTLQTVWSLGDNAEADMKCRLVCYKDEDGFHEKKHWP